MLWCGPIYLHRYFHRFTFLVTFQKTGFIISDAFDTAIFIGGNQNNILVKYKPDVVYYLFLHDQKPESVTPPYISDENLSNMESYVGISEKYL